MNFQKIDRKEFRRLHSLGKSDRQVSEALGCSRGYAATLRLKMGLTANLEKDLSWRPEELETLSELAILGRTAAQIAEVLGVKASRVRDKAKGMGLRLKAKGRPWSAAHDAYLCREVRRGANYTDLADTLDRTKGAVAARVGLLRSEGAIPPPEPKASATPERVGTQPLVSRVKVPVGKAVESPLTHLRDRHGAALIDELADLKKTAVSYQAIEAVAAGHGLAARQVQGIWHQVRVAR